MMPRYLTSSTSSIALLLIRIVTGLLGLFFAWKTTKFVLDIFKESLLIQSHSHSQKSKGNYILINIKSI